jgi:protocatechuate 3,4-dioxygenase beta subunit
MRRLVPLLSLLVLLSVVAYWFSAPKPHFDAETSEHRSAFARTTDAAPPDEDGWTASDAVGDRRTPTAPRASESAPPDAGPVPARGGTTLGTDAAHPGEQPVVVGVALDAADGRPIAGAEVRVRFGAPPNGEYDVFDHRTVEPTDAEGEFEIFLSDGDYRSWIEVEVRAQDHRAARSARIPVAQDPGPHTMVLSLEPLARVRGRVLDDRGDPVPAAWVGWRPGERGFGGHLIADGVVWFLEGASSEDLVPTQTDGAGEFVVGVDGNLPGRVLVRAEGYAPATSALLTLARGEQREGEVLVLERGAVLEGRVVGFPGERFLRRVRRANLRPQFSGPALAVALGEDGEFSFEGVAPGLYELRIGAEPRGDSSVEIAVARQMVVLAPGEQRFVEVEIGSAAEGATVEGRVRVPAGLAEGVGAVAVIGPSAEVPPLGVAAISAEDPAFAVDGLPEGEHPWICVLHSEETGQGAFQAGWVTVQGERTVQLAIDLSLREVQFTGLPPGATAVLLGEFDDPRWEAGLRQLSPLEADGEGRTAVHGLPPGSYRLELESGADELEFEVPTGSGRQVVER